MGVPADQEQRVIDASKRDISADSGHLDTGIFGTQFFFEVLAAHGLQELAYEAMNKKRSHRMAGGSNREPPHPWEQWDGSGSRNHPMFGGGLVWFYRKLAGMNADPENPGYCNIIFRPQPAGDHDICIIFKSHSSRNRRNKMGKEWE
ncbi:MAG: hypothetical protein MZU84_05215 [Sphingobacterium sp.]|nr:hypothetical protein [Sphingobacterium sp.]